MPHRISRIGGWLVVLAIAVAGPTAEGQRADREHWIATWGTAQTHYLAPAPNPPQAPAQSVSGGTPAQPAPPAAAPPAGGPARRFGIPPRIPGLNNQTVRMIVRASRGGQRVRIRLANALGARPVRIAAAHVAIRKAGSAIAAGSDRMVTFSGQPAAMLYAGQTLVSDAVALNVAPLSDLAVSLHLPGDTGPPTNHLFGLRPTDISNAGDFTGARDIADVATTTQSYYWLAGIDVSGGPDDGVLVTFGDSITDGDQSTPDANGAWPTVLAGRLQANRSTRGIGVVNAGISGNRVFGDNNSALARLDHDVFSVPGVRWMTVLEGINDITGATRGNGPPTLTAQDLIGGYRQIIQRAHLHGIKVIGCTMTPYGGSTVFTEAGESIRRAVNEWIRTGGEFDAVVDFDRATRDSTDPTRFRAAADSPDLLHPGDAGYRLMAEAFDLRVLR
jgi:lysophospholipase L1-like esterase